MDDLLKAERDNYKSIIREIDALEQKIALFPKGSIEAREANGSVYYYLKYRDGKNVKSTYLGTKNKAGSMIKGISKRQELEKRLRVLKEEKKNLDRIKRLLIVPKTMPYIVHTRHCLITMHENYWITKFIYDGNEYQIKKQYPVGFDDKEIFCKIQAEQFRKNKITKLKKNEAIKNGCYTDPYAQGYARS